jgi:crotonobetainyl-CoA:carnitine CoA-transferase CaiB-like acyl-CoA transferase
MATATHLAPAAVDTASVRRAAADAIERLRALELPAGEAWTMREVALTAPRAVATALFTDAHGETGHLGRWPGWSPRRLAVSRRC